MRITVFGASGSIGRHVVEQAVQQGHEVTAFTRDAVIVALGAGRNGGIREAGTRSVVDAMRETGVRRLVCQSTIGVGDSRGNLTLFWKYVMFGAVLRPAFQDHIKQEEVVRASGLDWTIVRPGAFVDGPAGGAYRHGFDGQDRTTQLKISRADVAAFLLAQVTEDAYLRRAVSLSY